MSSGLNRIDLIHVPDEGSRVLSRNTVPFIKRNESMETFSIPWKLYSGHNRIGLIHTPDEGNSLLPKHLSFNRTFGRPNEIGFTFLLDNVSRTRLQNVMSY
jgi:hypothetical protein